MMGQASGVQKSERRQRINTVIDHQFTPKLITDVFGYGGWNTRLIKGSLQPLQQSHPWVIRLLLRPAAHHYLGNTFDEHFARLGIWPPIRTARPPKTRPSPTTSEMRGSLSTPF